MLKKELEILVERLVSGDPGLTISELKKLKKVFSNKTSQRLLDDWLVEKWKAADSEDIDLDYNGLRKKVVELENRNKFHDNLFNKFRRFSKHYQRIAAILFFPVLISTLIYFILSLSSHEDFYTAEAPLGQKAKIQLSDSTVVWLNSGTTIKYSTDFNKKNRDITLDGEAFFDVRKNSDKPFFVHTSSVDIEVTGTRFNVNAYGDEPVIETALLEGHVNLIFKENNKKHELTPGSLLAYSKATGTMTKRKFEEDVTTAWKENRLIFENDNFAKLAKKIERWYDMSVVYDSLAFADNKLTVRLVEGERLSKLLEIIEATTDAKCTIEGNKIFITK